VSAAGSGTSVGGRSNPGASGAALSVGGWALPGETANQRLIRTAQAPKPVVLHSGIEPCFRDAQPCIGETVIRFLGNQIAGSALKPLPSKERRRVAS